MRVFLKMILIFVAVQLLGLYTGLFIIEDAPANPVVSEMTVVGTVPTFPLFVFYIILGAALFLLIIKLRIPLLFALLEFAVVSATSSVFFYSVFRPFMADPILAMLVSISSGCALILLKFLLPWLKNIAAILSSVGAGAAFGFSFSFFAALFFLFIMAAYDYISVFRTKHMVSMAKEIMKRNMSFTITSTHRLPSGKISRMDLGTGDLALPIMVSVAAFSVSPALMAFVFLGSVAGVAGVLFYAWKRRTFLPAVPFITMGISIGVLLFLFSGL